MVVIVEDVQKIAESLEILPIFAVTVSAEVSSLTVARQTDKVHFRLKPSLPDVASSRGTGHQREQSGCNATSDRDSDPAENNNRREGHFMHQLAVFPFCLNKLIREMSLKENCFI